MISNSPTLDFKLLEETILDYCAGFPDAQSELRGVMDSMRGVITRIDSDNATRLYGDFLTILDDAYGTWFKSDGAHISQNGPPHIATRLFGNLIAVEGAGARITFLELTCHMETAKRRATSRKTINRGFRPRDVAYQPLPRHG